MVKQGSRARLTVIIDLRPKSSRGRSSYRTSTAAASRSSKAYRPPVLSCHTLGCCCSLPTGNSLRLCPEHTPKKTSGAGLTFDQDAVCQFSWVQTHRNPSSRVVRETRHAVFVRKGILVYILGADRQPHLLAGLVKGFAPGRVLIPNTLIGHRAIAPTRIDFHV